MKPMRGKRLRMKGWCRVIQIWRAFRTSCRFCSAAWRSFFVYQAMAEQDTPDRDAVDRDIVTIRQFQHEIMQGQIRLFHHPRFDPATTARQFAVTATIALRARLKTSCFALQDHHVVDEAYRNPETSRRSSV